MRVMDSADDRLQLIFGTELFSEDGAMVRERGTANVGGQKRVMLEVGKKGSGELFELRVEQGGSQMARVNQVEEMVAEMCAMPTCTDAAADPILADPLQVEAVAAVAGPNWKSALKNLLFQLKRQRRIVAVKCQDCGQMLIDGGADPARKRVCQGCGKEF